MYNLYIYEKQKRDEENRKNTLIKSQELSRKRKLQVEDLSSNYRERVKNFISDVCNNILITYLHSHR
jgi:translation initiation factor IF-3